MQRIIFLIEQYGLILYALCGLGILWFVRSYFMGRQSRAAARFELEKEMAEYRLRNAVTAILFLLEAALIIMAIAQVVAPTLRGAPSWP